MIPLLKSGKTDCFKKNQSLSVDDLWREKLKDGGYEPPAVYINDCRKIKKLSRVWRIILRHLRMPLKNLKGLEVLEVGCGGGKQIIPFALNGAKCVGVDVSKDVLGRVKEYLKSVSRTCGVKMDIELICGDFFELNFSKKFDLVFNAGVIEHFLDDKERLNFQKKMFELTKSGGYVVSIVPNGIQPLREEMREKRLGGYDIPEVDYSPEIFKKELKECSGVNIDVFGHNIFNYIFLKRGKLKFFKKIFYLVWQVIPLSILPKEFVYRHSDALIGIAKKL